MKLYIAGPMSGKPLDNYPAFEEALELLRGLGYNAVSPHTVAQPDEILKSRAMGAAFRETIEYASIMQRCISLLKEATAVALLPGWTLSVGACREVRIAGALGKPCEEINRWVDLAPDLDLHSSRKIKWIGDSKFQPTQGYGGDAGFDLYVSETTVVLPSRFKDIPLGIEGVELPPGMWALLTGRSSTIRRGLLVTNGIIDNGYRGPLFAGTQNVGDAAITVREGERIAQLIPYELAASGITLAQVQEVSDSQRGTSSFGSTGT